MDNCIWSYAEGIGPSIDISAGDAAVDGDIAVINMSIVGVESLTSHQAEGAGRKKRRKYQQSGIEEITWTAGLQVAQRLCSNLRMTFPHNIRPMTREDARTAQSAGHRTRGHRDSYCDMLFSQRPYRSSCRVQVLQVASGVVLIAARSIQPGSDDRIVACGRIPPWIPSKKCPEVHSSLSCR